MTKSHPATVGLDVDVQGRQKELVRCHLGPSNSLLGSTRMVDYPTPPRTQSPATSLCGSSAPTTPSQGLGLLNCPFPSSLVDAYNTSASASYYPAISVGDWSLPASMCDNAFEQNSHLDLLPTASQAISSASLNSMACYTSPAASSSASRPTASANIDFALAQHHIPVMLHNDFAQVGRPTEQTDESESWFNYHINMERSQSSIDMSSYGTMKSPSPSLSHVSSARLVLSPGIGFDALPPSLDGPSQQLSSPPTARSESVESGTGLRGLARNRTPTRSRRHSASGERKHHCSGCVRSFDKKYNLREHEKKHDPSRISQFPCPEPGCGKWLGRKTDVTRHVQSVHEKAKKFVCTKCSKRFDRKDTLSR